MYSVGYTASTRNHCIKPEDIFFLPFFFSIPLGLNLLPSIYSPGHSQLIHPEQNHAKAVGRPSTYFLAFFFLSYFCSFFHFLSLFSFFPFFSFPFFCFLLCSFSLLSLLIPNLSSCPSAIPCLYASAEEKVKAEIVSP